MRTYNKNPAKIYDESFGIIESEINLGDVKKSNQSILIRMIHACGDVTIKEDFLCSDNARDKGIGAINNGANILTDTNMVSSAIIRKFIQEKNEVLCFLRDARVIPISKSNETTLSAAAVDLWLDSLQDAVVVIGNAPTALFRLLELIEIKDIRPALIIGIPVGFVGARESKEELIQNKKNIDYITLRGRRGGSAIAAAAFNAIALESKKL